MCDRSKSKHERDDINRGTDQSFVFQLARQKLTHRRRFSRRSLGWKSVCGRTCLGAGPRLKDRHQQAARAR